MHEIRLQPYKANAGGFQTLKLGTVGSYGIEQLRIIPGAAWDGLVITAVFSHNGKVLANPVMIPENGLIDVPPGATAQELTDSSPGVITFRGVSDGVQRITADVKYTCAGHGPVDGTAPEPTPSEFEQLTAEYQKRLDKAVPPDGEPGQVLTATDSGNTWAYPSGGGGSGGGYTIGAGLKYDPDSNILSVDTTDVPEQDNTKPITSAGVYTTLGNIDVLLGTI